MFIHQIYQINGILCVMVLTVCCYVFFVVVFVLHIRSAIILDYVIGACEDLLSFCLFISIEKLKLTSYSVGKFQNHVPTFYYSDFFFSALIRWYHKAIVIFSHFPKNIYVYIDIYYPITLY